MAMKTIKVAEATQLQLNWLVAEVEGKDGVLFDTGITRCIVIAAPSGVYKGTYSPSINWAQGGPIVEREGISIYRMTSDWSAAYNPSGAAQDGPTPLIAAMRCYCCTKLGEFVNIPEELCQQQKT